MTRALNVTITDSDKAVPVYIVGGGGGGDAIKTIVFQETYTVDSNTHEATYTLTNAADVLDMLDDVFGADDPMEAAVKYKVAYKSWYEDQRTECWLAWPQYEHEEGNSDAAFIAGQNEYGILAAMVGKVLPDGAPEAIYTGRGLGISRSDIDPTTGVLTKTGTPLG